MMKLKNDVFLVSSYLYDKHSILVQYFKSDFIALVTYYSVQDQIGFQNSIIKK